MGQGAHQGHLKQHRNLQGLTAAARSQHGPVLEHVPTKEGRAAHRALSQQKSWRYAQQKDKPAAVAQQCTRSVSQRRAAVYVVPVPLRAVQGLR